MIKIESTIICNECGAKGSALVKPCLNRGIFGMRAGHEFELPEGWECGPNLTHRCPRCVVEAVEHLA